MSEWPSTCSISESWTINARRAIFERPSATSHDDTRNNDTKWFYMRDCFKLFSRSTNCWNWNRQRNSSWKTYSYSLPPPIEGFRSTNKPWWLFEIDSRGVATPMAQAPATVASWPHWRWQTRFAKNGAISNVKETSLQLDRMLFSCRAQECGRSYEWSAANQEVNKNKQKRANKQTHIANTQTNANKRKQTQTRKEQNE